MIMYSALYQSNDPFGLSDEVVGINHPTQMKKKGMLLLHGGEDISPSIYNQSNNSYCYAQKTPSTRDIMEMEFINHAHKMGMPIIGICRGAQLLCAIDGGSLMQHIFGHVGRGHMLTDTITGEEVYSNSCHHQMCMPRDSEDNIILAVATDEVAFVDENDNEGTTDVVPEIVYYKGLKAIGVQGHPEWMEGTHFNKYCTSLIKEYLLKD